MGGEEGGFAAPPATAASFVDEEDQEVGETLPPYPPAPASAAGCPLRLCRQPLTPPPPPPSVAPAPASSASALAAHRRRLPTRLRRRPPTLPPSQPAAHSASAIACPGELPMSHGARSRGGGHRSGGGAPAWLGRPSQRQTRTGEGTGWQRERWGGGDHDDGRSSGAGDGSRRIEVMTDGRLLSRVSLPSFSEVHHRAASSSSPSAVAAVAVHPNLLASRPQPSTPTSSPHACRRRPPPAPDPTHRRPPPARTR